MLAALGPKMLQLAARYAGAHPYFTTPAHTAEARAVLGPEPLLIPEQAVSLDPLAAEGVRAYAARYLTMANYTRMLKKLRVHRGRHRRRRQRPAGRTRSSPSGAAAGPAVRAHLEAGADHVVVQPLGADGAFDVAQLSELADEVDDLLKR